MGASFEGGAFRPDTRKISSAHEPYILVSRDLVFSNLRSFVQMQPECYSFFFSFLLVFISSGKHTCQL
ncbi:hypothetical protein L596_013248 [Steinernema carpocapsae]|uniref:Uncharacterized protein n=1 Tax=Steinernema carpocapsae TaxID=34508 RepID=A0A4V6A513_STECR|nr:hypothetical protein L596_013248 [Steinernema carpocapsae]